MRENSDLQNKFIKQKLLSNDSLMRALCFAGLDEVKSCLNFAQIEKTTSGNIIHDQSLLNNSVEIFSFVALVFCFGNLEQLFKIRRINLYPVDSANDFPAE